MNPMIRDLRYVTEDGKVLLRPEYDRDVIEPDSDKIRKVYGLESDE